MVRKKREVRHDVTLGRVLVPSPPAVRPVDAQGLSAFCLEFLPLFGCGSGSDKCRFISASQTITQRIHGTYRTKSGTLRA